MEKEIVNQGQETQSLIEDKHKEKHAKTVIKLTKTKHKERILKAAREKQQVTYKRNPKHLIAEFFSRNSAGQKGMAGYI